FGFSENVRGSVKIYFRGGLVVLQAALAQQHRSAQDRVVQRFLFAQQLDDFRANRQQAFAAKLDIQIASSPIQLILSEFFIKRNHLIVHDVRVRHQNYQDATIGQADKPDVPQAILGQRRPDYDADVFRKFRKYMGGFLEQTIRPHRAFTPEADALDRP